MENGILTAVGNTPLVRLEKVLGDVQFQLFAKLEALNPGGSMKDRPALSIIRHGIETGAVRPGTVVIESSSGNMGIGLAQICSYYGLRFICVVDPKTTQQNISILRAYGAEIDLVREPDRETGEFLLARKDRVKYLIGTIEDSFWPDQYSNIYNPIGHYDTLREIVSALGRVDYLFCATSTCGTIRGCAEYARQHDLRLKLVAVDAIGSVIFGGQSEKRLIPGHGAAVRPALFEPGLADRCIRVSDLDCVIGCRRLVRREAVLAGGSSGAIITAVESVRGEIAPGSVVVVILADRGERYLDTIFSDEWVMGHFGDVSHLWEESLREEPCVMATY